MSPDMTRASNRTNHWPTDGYAFFEDARDATRYAQRIAVLRQAQYHRQRTERRQAHDPVATASIHDERF